MKKQNIGKSVLKVIARRWISFSFFLALTGCSGGGDTASSGVPKEASDAANHLVLDVGFKNCGDYWGSEHPRDMVYPDTEYQFKNLRLDIKPLGQPLSSADKLNGVEWQGLLSVVAEATRQRVKGARDWSGWSNGLNGAFNSNMTLVKKNGQWSAVGIELLGAKAACPE